MSNERDGVQEPREASLHLIMFETDEEAQKALDEARDFLKSARTIRLMVTRDMYRNSERFGLRESLARADEVSWSIQLRLMQFVAAAKHKLDLPTEDLEQEERAKKAYLEEASQLGCSTEDALLIIDWEIKKNKEIQERYRELYRLHDAGPDLA